MRKAGVGAGHGCRRAACPAAAVLAALAWLPAARAEVTRFDVLQAARPVFEGRTFGPHGPAEKLTARATVEVDPDDLRNAVIADLALAPRNAAGRVEAVADVVILRPAGGGNGTLLLELPNRGRKAMMQLFDDAADGPAQRLERAGDAGSGFLLGQGYTLAWVGWQAGLAPGLDVLRLEAPVLRGVTGPSREEFVFDHLRDPVTATLSYPAAAVPGDAALTVRAHTEDPRERPPGLSFRFLDASTVKINRPADFDAGAIYELTYTARDPVVAGLGFAAVRDVAAFLRRETAGNPLGASIARAYAHGISQSGRALRDFLYLGFNEDEQGRAVFDAVNPHIAGTRRTFTNARFAQPGRNPSHHADRLYPADQFPFTYAVTDDPLSGRRDGLLRRCEASGTCPKVMQTDSTYEFFGARASLLVTDPAGRALDLPGNVRAYMVAGAPHFAAADAVATRTDACALPLNPINAGPTMRALLVALDHWAKSGEEPPASRTPSLADGTLVPPSDPIPAIPGLPYAGLHTPVDLVDHGPMPPVAVGRYPVFVPRMDEDGLPVAGVRSLAVAVPRATYTGWNPRADGYAPGALCTNMGAAAPFAATRAEQEAAGDPRRSVEERYPTEAAYVDAVRAAADRLLADRLLLPDDAAAGIRAAEAGTLARLGR